MKQRAISLPCGILKIKKGYNPNSSSIGTVLYSFPLSFIALSSILALCAALINVKENKENKENKEKKEK